MIDVLVGEGGGGGGEPGGGEREGEGNFCPVVYFVFHLKKNLKAKKKLIIYISHSARLSKRAFSSSNGSFCCSCSELGGGGGGGGESAAG